LIAPTFKKGETMDKILKKILLFTVCTLCSLHAQEGPTQLYGHTFYSPRSQGCNAARELVGQHPYQHRYDAQHCYGTFSATLEYAQTYKSHRIAEHFWGVDTVRFSGSQVDTRSEDDVLADYFGLSPMFDSELTFRPKATTFLIDFNLYAGLDGLCPGLYFQVIAPAAWVEQKICLSEAITDNGMDDSFPALYMAVGAVTPPITSAKRPFDGDVTYGQVKQGMKYGKIGCLETGKLADILMVLGWDFVRRERGHVGANLRLVAPTGTKINGEYMFQPVVGNGHHWEFGAGLDGTIVLWEKDGEQTIDLTAQLFCTHLFRSCQHRSFDFCKNGFGSRFILLKEFDAAGTYDGTCLPAINVTTLACKVSADIQVDAVIMASYHTRNWTFDFGYDGWVRSREKICITGSIEDKRYGMKGIQNVAIDAVTPDNKTQSTATLHGNPLTPTVQTAVADTSTTFIKTSDLDPASASMERSISNKIFLNLSYAWDNDTDARVIPYLGIGCEFDFEGVRQDNSRPNKITWSQAGVMVKAGLKF
jgi:hypothetical protein